MLKQNHSLNVHPSARPYNYAYRKVRKIGDEIRLLTATDDEFDSVTSSLEPVCLAASPS